MAGSNLDFQTTVSVVPAPGVEGDFASMNPIYTWPAGPGGLVAGAAGVLAGRFLWPQYTALDVDNAPTIVNNFGSGQPIGILGRRLQGIITVFLDEAGMRVPAGLGVAAITAADLWVVNRGTTQALIGQKVYANFADGSMSFAATATPTTGGSATGSTVAAATNAFTGSIAGNVLTVTAVGSGTLYLGTTVSGSGVASGTMISAQLTGTRGSTGTYALNIGEQTVASEAMTGTYGLLTLGTLTGVAFAINNVISGSGVTAGTIITDSITGSGGTGATMVVTPNTVVGSTTITVAAINAETGWYCQSSGAVGEIVKISRLP